MDKARHRFPPPPSLHRKRHAELHRGPGSVHSSVAEAIGMRIVPRFAPGSILPKRAKWATDFTVSPRQFRGIKILMANNLSFQAQVGSRVEPSGRWSLLDHDIFPVRHRPNRKNSCSAQHSATSGNGSISARLQFHTKNRCPDHRRLPIWPRPHRFLRAPIRRALSYWISLKSPTMSCSCP